MGETEFAPGDVVEVLDDRLRFWGDDHPRAEVVKRDGDLCTVRMSLDTYHRFHEVLGDLVTMQPVTALKNLGAWPSPEERMEFLFGKGRPHSLYTLSHPFNASCVCMHAAHDGAEPPRAAKRIMVNVWGSVFEFDACKEHAADLDGLLTETILWGRQWLKDPD